MRLSKPVLRLYQEIAARYVRDTGEAELNASQVVAWAQQRADVCLPGLSLADIHAERLSEALRRHTVKDSQGRDVRLYHCVEQPAAPGGVTQRYLWAHIDDASEEFLLTSLAQRRRGVERDAERLRVDLEYINARRAERGQRPIQMSLNFGEAG